MTQKDDGRWDVDTYELIPVTDEIKADAATQERIDELMETVDTNYLSHFGYTKDQILEFYINNIYFANGYYGVEAAAKGYFSKSVSELTLAEQAFIAAIPNSPNRYNPLTNYDNTVTRKNLIHDKLNCEGKISNLDYYLAKEEEILTAAAKNEKPDANDKIITGMVKGRLNKELKEICLMDQVYVKAEDGKQSVSKYVEEVAKANNAKIAIKGFVRMETGEGIEKKEEDFAAEVAAQMAGK